MPEVIEGIIDHRGDSRIVHESDRKDVTRLRHSDRDLLDADQAPTLPPGTLVLPSDEGVQQTVVPIEYLKPGVAEHPAFAGRAFLLKNLLTPSECKAVCAAAERQGMSPVLLCGGSKRRCERIAFRAPELDELLWRRLAPFLPELECTPENNSIFLSRGMEGRWVPERLSGVIRVVKYVAGGHIAPHFDGEWVDSEDVRSIKTVLLYLNSGYPGGKTNLLDHRDENVGERYITTERGATQAAKEDVVAVVPAEDGIALVFDAKMLHEGTELEGGEKWLLRADVVYRRVERLYKEGSDRAKAMDLLNEAEFLEEEGRIDLAIRNYKAAYRLCPELQYS